MNEKNVLSLVFGCRSLIVGIRLFLLNFRKSLFFEQSRSIGTNTEQSGLFELKHIFQESQCFINRR